MKIAAISLLFLSMSSQAYGAVDPATLLTAVSEGSKSVVQAMNLAKETFIDPLRDEVKASVSRINTNFDGINADEKKMVTRALQGLERVDVEINGVRIILVEMARSTIDQSTTLRRILSKVNSEDTDAVTIKKLRYVARYMVQLMDTSKKVLDEAKKKYDLALRDLANSKGELVAFKNRIDGIGDEENARFQAWVSEKRAIVYGTTVLGGPITVAVAAGILENEISKYRDSVRGLQLAANRAATQATKAINSTGDKINQLEKERKLVGRWRGRVSQLNNEFASEQSLIDHVTWLGMKDNTVQKMLNLEKAAKNYICAVEKDAPEC